MLNYCFSALVAQRIEQLPSKQWVVGSIPARGTIFTLKFHVFAPYFPHTYIVPANSRTLAKNICAKKARRDFALRGCNLSGLLSNLPAFNETLS